MPGLIILLIRVSARCILKKTDSSEVVAACDKLDLEVEQVQTERQSGCYFSYLLPQRVCVIDQNM